MNPGGHHESSAELTPSNFCTMLRLANLYVEARWMSEKEWLAWRRAILSRMELPAVSGVLQ